MPFANRSALDFTQRWIITDNWTYTADVTPFLSTIGNKSQSTLLVFYGLDTVANIVRRAYHQSALLNLCPQTLAGQPVAWTENEFRQ